MNVTVSTQWLLRDGGSRGGTPDAVNEELEGRQWGRGDTLGFLSHGIERLG
jgi:hypothetical protein